MAEWDWIDVSVPIGNDTPIFPGDPIVRIEPAPVPPGAPYHVSRIEMGSHTATHFDAPAHFIPDGATVPEIPLARLNGPCWVLELPAAPAIEPEHLQRAWPEVTGVERVLLRTPNSQRWGTPHAPEHAQALSAEGAQWLLAQGVRLVGIDALSIEQSKDGQYPVHFALLGAGTLIIEGLNLAHVSPGPYELLCLPLRLEAPDASPVRALVRRM